MQFAISEVKPITSSGWTLNENRTWEAGFVCSMFLLRVAPYPRSIRELPLKCTCYVLTDGPAGGLQGCKIGTWNLHRMVLNWMLIKFMDIYWPRQTRQIQTCLHSLYTPQIRGSISPPRGSSRLFPSVYISISFTCQLYTYIYMYAHIYAYLHMQTHTWIAIYLNLFIYFQRPKYSQILIPSLQTKYFQQALSHQIRITRKYCIQFYWVHT